MAAKSKSWLGEFWRPLAALLLWVLGMVPLIAAPPLLSSVVETRIGGLTAFPVDCIPAAPLFPSDLTRACGPPLYDVASECSVAANRGGRIFYVGEGAETLARKTAAETGYKTIFDTWYGKIGEKLTPSLSQGQSRKMWDFLSARFANGAKQGDDIITVFGRHRGTGEHTLPLNTKAAWKRVEYPILDFKKIDYRVILTE